MNNVKNHAGIPLPAILISLGVAFLMIIFGSFFDLDISRGIADTSNGFGAFVETWGELPAYLMIAFGATIFFTGFISKKGWGYKVAAIIVGLLGIGLPGYYWGESLLIKEGKFGLLLSDKAWVCLLVSYLIHIAFAVGMYFLFRKYDTNTLVKIGLIIVVTSIGQFAFQNILKPFGGRPRYRFLISEANQELGYTFRNWWEFALGSSPSGDGFRSWPSGHTSTAAACIEIGLLVNLLPKDDPRRKWMSPLLLGIGGAYTLIVAYARVRYGAHYLSDVGFGLLITTLFMWLSCWAGDKIEKKILGRKEKPDEPAEPNQEA